MEMTGTVPSSQGCQDSMRYSTSVPLTMSGTTNHPNVRGKTEVSHQEAGIQWKAGLIPRNARWRTFSCKFCKGEEKDPRPEPSRQYFTETAEYQSSMCHVAENFS